MFNNMCIYILTNYLSVAITRGADNIDHIQNTQGGRSVLKILFF